MEQIAQLHPAAQVAAVIMSGLGVLGWIWLLSKL
jgi:hypothetical protein